MLNRVTGRSALWALVGAGMIAGAATPAIAASHLWRFSEVFSDASGYVQFVEMLCLPGANNEGGLGGKDVRGTNLNRLVLLPANVTPPTGGRYYLLATPAAATMLQALTPPVVPDFIIPPGSAPFVTAAGDTVRYFVPGGPYDTWNFAALPTDGVSSMNRFGTPPVRPNTPTNYAGVTGTLNVGCPDVCGDLDYDGDVDFIDYLLFLRSYNHVPGDPAYNACADYQPNGIVNLVDLRIWFLCRLIYLNGLGQDAPVQDFPVDAIGPIPAAE